jgi:hypothetical protein
MIIKISLSNVKWFFVGMIVTFAAAIAVIKLGAN